jgi:chromosome segregation ATPase
MDGPDVMAERGEENPLVGELLRANAELAAELRSLSAGRTPVTRQGRVPAARGIAQLQGDRDAVASQLEATQAALEATQGSLEATQGALEDAQAHREGLERQNQAMAAEIVRLRTGPRGVLRRLRGRLLERAGLFPSR